MYSAYKLNKQGDNIQLWHTLLQVWNQSVVPCPVLTVVSWPAYRFLRRQERRSGIPISLRIFHSLLWSTQRIWHSQSSRSRCFSGTLLLFLWSNECWHDPRNKPIYHGQLIFNKGYKIIQWGKEEALQLMMLGQLGSVQFSSVAQSCPTLCDPMDCNTPGFPVHLQLQELTQTHVHRVGVAIQPSHPLSSPPPPAPNPSQHQGLLQWVNSSHQVAKVLKLQLQHHSFQCIFRADFL